MKSVIPSHRRKRGQTSLESLVALILFAIAGLGAWKLYGEPIRQTTKSMIEFFRPGTKQ